MIFRISAMALVTSAALLGGCAPLVTQSPGQGLSPVNAVSQDGDKHLMLFGWRSSEPVEQSGLGVFQCLSPRGRGVDEPFGNGILEELVVAVWEQGFHRVACGSGLPSFRALHRASP